MANATNLRRWGLASFLGGATLAVVTTLTFGLLPNDQISGQVSGTTPAAGVVTYTANVVNQIIPGTRADEIKDVIAFPDQPAMLVRTEKALTLWVRQGNTVRSLMEIPLDAGVNRVEFLDDGSTFVVLSKRRARVFALNKTITFPETRRR